MITTTSLKLDDCEKQENLPFVLRFGAVEDSQLPALLPMPWHQSLFVLHSQLAYATIANVLQNYLLQLLLQTPNHKIKVILADAGLSDSFSALDQVRLKTQSKAVAVVSTVQEQLQCLKDLLANARERKTTLAQAGYDNWQAYQEASAHAAPTLVVCISDARRILQHEESFDSLAALVEQGARLGILVWAMLVDNWAAHLNSSEYERCTVRVSRLYASTWQLTLDSEKLRPKVRDFWDDTFITFDELGILAEQDSATELATAVSRIADSYASQQSATGTDFINIKIGEYQTQPFYFSMGSASDVYHGLVAGATRTGKTSFITQLITQACEQYGPEQLQFFLFDYKDGVSFGLFEQLAHVPVLHLDNADHNALLHYLNLFVIEIPHRAQLFKQAGRTVSTIHAYNALMKQQGGQVLPYWLLVVDEVQSIFEHDYGLKNKIAQAIKEIARKGGAFGLHMLFSTQTYRGVDLDAGAKGQFHLRIGFKLQNSMDCRYLFDKDNDAPLQVPRYHAIYNASGGDVSGNQLIKLDFIEPLEIDSRVEQLRNKHCYQPDIRFAYTKPSSNKQEKSEQNTNKPNWL